MTALNETRYMQYVAALVATLSVASVATYMAWSSPALPQLTSKDSPTGTPITPEEGSWIASSFLLGCSIGGFIAGWVVEKFGRRGSLLLSGLPMFAPWIIIYFAESALVICIARVLAGIAGTVIITSVSIYNGEIAEKDIRGKLGTFFNMLRLTGSLYILSVGPFISYGLLALTCSALPLIFMAIFYFMPETPYYLIKTGKLEKAQENLIRLSRNNTDEKTISNQLKEIQTTVEYDMKNKSTLWELLSKPEYRKSLIVMTGVKTLQQFSGSNAIEPYIQTIIESSKSSISPEVSSIICGVVQIPAVILAAALVDKLGRKPLLIISSLGCALALIGEGTYFYLQDGLHADVSSISWLPTTSLVLYLLMNPIGIFTLPYVLLGEMFATNVKGLAVSVFTLYGCFLGFLSVKFFDPISRAWGMYTMFWIFAALCILGALFVYFVQPETKGKTFAEIQEKLNRNRNVVTRSDNNNKV